MKSTRRGRGAQGSWRWPRRGMICCGVVQRVAKRLLRTVIWLDEFLFHSLFDRTVKDFGPGSAKGRTLPSVGLTDCESRNRLGPSFYKGANFHGSATLSRFADGAPRLRAPHSCRKPALDFQRQAAHAARARAAS